MHLSHGGYFMKTLVLLLLAVILSSGKLAYAGDYFDDYDDYENDSCGPDHKVCFNVYCNFKKKNEHSDQNCEAAAKFTQWVSKRGYEIRNESDGELNPLFEVKCGTDLIYTGIGRRFTDRNGTRIQGSYGPFPGIHLPKYSLEAGKRTVDSCLDLRDANLDGYCFVYTGAFVQF